MPAAIGAAAATAMGFAAGTTAFAVASSVVGLVVSLAISAVATALLGPKVPGQKPPAGRMQMRQEPAPARQRIYGRAKVSGPLGLIRSRNDAGNPSSDRDILHLVVLLAGHEIDGYESYWADQRQVTIDGNGDATDSYYNRGGSVFMSIYPHVGASDQAADPVLVNDLDDWTSDHRLRGIAYMHVKLDHRDWQTGNKVYANGVPQMRAVVRGAKVFDPRLEGSPGQDPDDPSTWEWSDNAALCVADFMHLPREEGGLGIPWSAIDLDALAAAADRCDEQIELAFSGSPPETESWYTCNGVFELDERPLDILAKLLSAMAGKVVWSGGKWRIHAGGWDLPAQPLTLTADDLRAPVTVDDAVDAFSEINGVRGVFFSPDRHWQPTDFPPVQNATYVSEDGGDQLWQDVQWDFTTSAAMAQRLAKIELEKARRPKLIRFPAQLTALPIEIHEVVQVTLPHFGWSEKTFRVESWSLVPPQGEDDGYGVDLVLREEDEEVWAWDPFTDEQEFEVAPPADTDAQGDVGEPTDVTVSSSQADVILGEDVALLGRAQVTWTEPTDTFVARYLIQWRVSGMGGPYSASAYVPAGTTDYLASPLQIGETYDFIMYAENGRGIRSDAVVPTGSPVTISGDDAPPAAPSAFDAVSDGGSPPVVTLTWRNPGDVDYRRTRIYRNTINDSDTAVEITDSTTWVYRSPNEFCSFEDDTVLGGNDYYYWLKAEDSSGNLSVFSAVASVAL